MVVGRCIAVLKQIFGGDRVPQVGLYNSCSKTYTCMQNSFHINACILRCRFMPSLIPSPTFSPSSMKTIYKFFIWFRMLSSIYKVLYHINPDSFRFKLVKKLQTSLPFPHLFFSFDAFPVATLKRSWLKGEKCINLFTNVIIFHLFLSRGTLWLLVGRMILMHGDPTHSWLLELLEMTTICWRLL